MGHSVFVAESDTLSGLGETYAANLGYLDGNCSLHLRLIE
jgi:hypothetical protein